MPHYDGFASLPYVGLKNKQPTAKGYDVGSLAVSSETLIASGDLSYDDDTSETAVDLTPRLRSGQAALHVVGKALVDKITSNLERRGIIRFL